MPGRRAHPDFLTFKERAFVKEYCFGETRGQASNTTMKVYNASNKKSADIMTTVIMKRPAVRNAIEKLLEKHGLTDDKIFKKIEEGLDANIITQFRGEAVLTDLPDYDKRHKFLRETLKIGGYYAPVKKESRNLNIDMQVESMPPEQMKALLSSMLKKVKNNDNK